MINEKNQKNQYVSRFVSRSIAFVLSVALFISIFAFSSSATPDRGVGNKTLLEHHFELAGIDGLVNDHLVPPNVEGSCGYVAMSMLLSYYDTYWHRDFVPEKYEMDEGIYDPELHMIVKTFNAGSEASRFNTKKSANSQYNFTNFVNEYNDTYLQPHLINVDRYSNSLLLIPNLFAILDDTMVSSLRRYLYNECDFDENDVVVNIMRETDTNDTALYNKMKEQIALGNPVIYYGSKSVTEIDITSAADWSKVGGHYMIAYDVCTNDGEEDIKLNLGWNMPEGNTTVMLSDCEYTNFNSIIWLEINKTVLTHEHDQNYYNLETEEQICSCKIYSTHPEHNSNHISISSNDGCFNSTHHWNNACHCGEPGPNSTMISHNLSYTYIEIPSTIHFETCSDCGYGRYVEHEYIVPHSPTDTGHSLKCACGATSSSNQTHYSHRYEKFNNSLHSVYCECGYLIGSESHQMVSTGLGGRCTHCGYTSKEIPGPGQIILGEEDEQPTE